MAFLNYTERFDQEHIDRLERHLLTDEVSVLLSEKAVLVIGEDQQIRPMKKNTIYNVKKAVWHAICVSKDASVLIVENTDTSVENSEYISIDLKLDRLNDMSCE